MKYTKIALNVSGRGEKFGTDGDKKQVIYITWPHQSLLSTINAVQYTLAYPNRGVPIQKFCSDYCFCSD